MKTIEARCTNIVKTKNDRNVPCGAFVAEFRKKDVEIILVCRKCSQMYIVRRNGDSYDVFRKTNKIYLEELKVNTNGSTKLSGSTQSIR